MPRSILAIARVRKSGNSVVFVIPPIVRKFMGLNLGDYICMRITLPYGTFCIWPQPEVPHLADIPSEDRPPLKPESLRNAGSQDSKAQPTD